MEVANKIDGFLIVLFYNLYGSIMPFIDYSKSRFSFTTCNSALTWLNSTMKTEAEVTVERLLFYSLLVKWLNWHQAKRCRTSKVVSGYKTKFRIFWELYNSPFHGEQTKINVLNRFMKLQKTYMALKRFAYLWKFKRAPMSVTTDLYFTEIDPQKDSTFILYQNNAKFSFKVSELFRIMESAICHHFEDNFEIESHPPKNPYNKLVFGLHDLYNIYHHVLLQTKQSVPIFFRLWFEENFDLRKFTQKNDLLLEELCIKNFIATLDTSSRHVYEDAMTMILENRYASKWNIHRNFSKEEVVKKVRHCLYEFYMINLPINIPDETLLLYEKELHHKLTKAYLGEPSFGTIKKKEPSFNDIRLISKNKFMFDPTQKTTTAFIFGSQNEGTYEDGINHLVNSNSRKRRKKRITDPKYCRRNKNVYPDETKNVYKMFGSFVEHDLIDSISNPNSFLYRDGRDNNDNVELYHTRINGLFINDTLSEITRVSSPIQVSDIEDMIANATADALLMFRENEPLTIHDSRITFRESLESTDDILPFISDLFTI